MKQRRKQPEKTRQALLEAAGAGLSHHGYSATGLGEIVIHAGVTKGALFHHFPDKRALAAAWISDVLSAAVAELWIAPLEQIGSLDAFRSFCRSRCVELRAGDSTSALVSLAAESSADPVLGAALEEVFTAWRAAITAWLERGKSAGWIHHSIQPAVEAAFLVSAIAGFTVTTKSSQEETIRRTCATALEAYLETLRAQ